MLSKTVQDALTSQIAEEHYSSLYYLAMASWCDTKGFSGAAKFLYGHSEEERSHMIKIFHYLNDAGGHARLTETKLPPDEFESLAVLFEQVLQHEKHISSCINELASLAMTEKDFATMNFLQWFLSEQHEEERLFQTILDKLEMIGGDSSRLFWIDKELEGMAGQRVDTAMDE